MNREFAFPSAIFVKLMIVMEFVLLVTKVTLFQMELVLFLKLKSLAQLTLVAEPGTGTTKSVSNAQPDGPSTNKEFAFPSMITVLPSTKQELV